jgi:hypothetical protein
LENNNLLREILREQSYILVKLDLPEFQSIYSLGEVSRADNRDLAKWDADSRLFDVVSRKPDIAGPLVMIVVVLSFLSAYRL